MIKRRTIFISIAILVISSWQDCFLFAGGLKQIKVFSTEEVDGVKYGYRIPSLVNTQKGTLLAFAERRVGLHDHAQNDIVLKRSFNNGETWENMQIIADFGNSSLNDPLAVVLESGRILLMFKMYPYGVHARNSGWIQMADNGYDGPRNTKAYITWSDDDGVNWETPKEITKMIRPHDRINSGSPGIGIQLKRGEYKGRIVMPLYFTKKINDNERSWTNAVAWSNDEGATWTISNDISQKDQTGYGNEAQVVELSDGSLLFVARNQGGFHRKV
ncbi:MAG: exo-alpha-sialidase, partial [Cyclobacteriaceae bacterium]|nr:exo-alpha-sialidase [Cyclobacteriaceae bacterium]